MVVFRLAGKAGDDVGAKSKDAGSSRKRIDRRGVGCRRVPVPTHALEQRIGARLQWRVEMWCDAPGLAGEEIGQTIIDFRGLYGRQSKANVAHTADEGLQELAK